MGDLGCDWYCDSCGAYMNYQPGFSAGGDWTCTKCGADNDVSENNIIDDEDDYTGSAQYYDDEEDRLRREEEHDRELGIDTWD